MTDHSLTKSAKLPAFTLALMIGAFVSTGTAQAPSAADEGRKLAFDRGTGNCLTCHVIKGGDLPGTIGPELVSLRRMCTWSSPGSMNVLLERADSRSSRWRSDQRAPIVAGSAVA